MSVDDGGRPDSMGLSSLVSGLKAASDDGTSHDLNLNEFDCINSLSLFSSVVS